jgi:hypothetical protein
MPVSPLDATKTQIVVAYLASALLMLGVFYQPLGLSEAWGMIFPFAAIVCWIVFFILRHHQKAHGTDAPTPPVPASRQKKIRLLSLSLMIVVSLSGPWWLPYTGTRLPFAQMVIVAIITCITCVTIYFIASRRSTPKA